MRPVRYGERINFLPATVESRTFFFLVTLTLPSGTTEITSRAPARKVSRLYYYYFITRISPSPTDFGSVRAWCHHLPACLFMEVVDPPRNFATFFSGMCLYYGGYEKKRSRRRRWRRKKCAVDPSEIRVSGLNPCGYSRDFYNTGSLCLVLCRSWIFTFIEILPLASFFPQFGMF